MAQTKVQAKEEDVVSMVQSAGGLTLEVLAVLGAPIPTDQIKYRKGDYGKDLAYTSTEFVQDRLTSVDTGWESKCRKEDDIIICTLTVLGVSREATAGIEERRTFKNRETGKETMESNHVVKTAAEAKAFKRAASYFLVARELWTDLPTDRPAYQSNGATSQTRAATTSKQVSGDIRDAYSRDGYTTPNMGKWLEDLGVSRDAATQLTLGELVDGKRNGEASQMINILMQAKRDAGEKYKDNAAKHVRHALIEVGREDLLGVPKRAPAIEYEDDEDAD
jgi:hypothetical protein